MKESLQISVLKCMLLEKLELSDGKGSMFKKNKT